MTDRILTLEQTDSQPPILRVVCSICKQPFKAGDKYLGQVAGVHSYYTSLMHLGHRVDVPTSTGTEIEILDFFHKDCLG